MNKITDKKTLLAKAECLWQAVINTPGVYDLAAAITTSRAFSLLSKQQRITVAVIAQIIEEGFRAIQEESHKTPDTTTQEEQKKI